MKDPKNNNESLTGNYLTKSNIELHQKLKYLVRTERNLLTTILDHLAEVKKRRIYAELGYSSLFNYCIKELNYSESSALRRIQALKLTEELPEIKDKLNSGALNLSTVSLAQTFFQKEKSLKEKSNSNLPLLSSLNQNSSHNVNLNQELLTSKNLELKNSEQSPSNDIVNGSWNTSSDELQILSKFTDRSEKLEFLKSLENKTTKQVQKELVKISPESTLTFETQKPLTENLTELKITLNETQLKKLNRLKNLKGNLKSTADVLEWLLDQSLKKIDPNHKVEDWSTNASPSFKTCENQNTKTSCNSLISENPSTTQLRNHNQKSATNNTSSVNFHNFAQNHTTVAKVEKRSAVFETKNHNSSKKISLKKQVYMKSKGQCTFIAENGHKCLETHGLEVDHIHPKAKGGDNSIQNLRLLCKTHNQLEAIRQFGRTHMQKYLG